MTARLAGVVTIVTGAAGGLGSAMARRLAADGATVAALDLATDPAEPRGDDLPGSGRVVNVASRSFFTGAPGQIGYIAGKGALLGMTGVMARELGEHHICVNAVLPAQVATPGTRAHSGDDVFARTMSQQAIREFVTPEDVAGLVAFPASADGARITGQSLVCDGGGLLH